MPTTIERLHRGPRMSRAVIHGETIYTNGHLASDPSAGVAGQTRDILAQLEGLLAEAGSDKSHILSAQIWLADITTFEEMNSVWDAWVDKENPPVRACVESKLARAGCSVEIAMIAARAT